MGEREGREGRGFGERKRGREGRKRERGMEWGRECGTLNRSVIIT